MTIRSGRSRITLKLTMPIASVNPATGQLLRSFEEDAPEVIQRKLAGAAGAWERWRRKPVAARAAVVARAAELLETEREAFGRLMTLEMGKLAAAAAGEARKCATGVPVLRRARRDVPDPRGREREVRAAGMRSTCSPSAPCWR